MTSDKNRYFLVVPKLTGAVSLPFVAIGTLVWAIFGNTTITFSAWLGFAAVTVLPILLMASKYAVDKLHQELTHFYWQQRLSLAIEMQSLVLEETADEISERARENSRKELERYGFLMLNIEHELEEMTK